MREDGYIYSHTYKGRECWRSPEVEHRQRIHSAVCSAKKRAAEKGVPFDVDTDYLQSLFPEDRLCPALGIEMRWGDASGRENSPSIDRIKPELGYVRGNLRWLSQQANQIKTNATTAQVCAVANFLRKNDC